MRPILICMIAILCTLPSCASNDQLAFSVDVRGETGFRVWSAATGKSRRLAEGYRVGGLCFSPDGKRIAFLAAHPQETQNEKEELSRVPGEPPPAVWNDLDYELFILDMANDSIKQVTTGFWGGQGVSIAWRPGTEQVAAARTRWYFDRTFYEPVDAGLWLINVKTGELIQVIASADSGQPVNVKSLFNQDGSMLACLRAGRYGAVLEIKHPDKWYRLDRPGGLMDGYSVMDWVWQGDNLLVGTTGQFGGIWRWRVKEKPAFTHPIMDEPSVTVPHNQTSAELLFGKGQTVYALALSPDRRRIAYLMDSGVWLYDFRNRTPRRLESQDDIPGIKDLRGIDMYIPSLADLSWSGSGRYLSVRIYEEKGNTDKLALIDTTSNEIIKPFPGNDAIKIFSAWQPANTGKG